MTLCEETADTDAETTTGAGILDTIKKGIENGLSPENIDKLKTDFGSFTNSVSVRIVLDLGLIGLWTKFLLDLWYDLEMLKGKQILNLTFNFVTKSHPIATQCCPHGDNLLRTKCQFYCVSIGSTFKIQ